MKINPINNPDILRTYQATKPAPAGKGAALSRDEVSVSGEALKFSQALSDAQGAIELRTPDEKARIAEIAQAVRQGTYRIDSDKIADKILESVLRGK